MRWNGASEANEMLDFYVTFLKWSEQNVKFFREMFSFWRKMFSFFRQMFSFFNENARFPGFFFIFGVKTFEIWGISFEIAGTSGYMALHRAVGWVIGP